MGRVPHGAARGARRAGRAAAGRGRYAAAAPAREPPGGPLARWAGPAATREAAARSEDPRTGPPPSVLLVLLRGPFCAPWVPLLCALCSVLCLLCPLLCPL